MKMIFKKRNKISSSKRLMEASEWVMDIESESMSPEMQADYMNWLYKDYENRTKRDLVESVWESLDELKDNPLTLQVLEKSMEREHAPARQKWFSSIAIGFFQIRFAAMAAMVLLVISGFWVMQTNMFNNETYRTAIGEQTTVYLADGSSIHLDTQTVVTTSFTKKFRNVELEEGKALFSVAHDPSRPFIVTSGQVAIRALGTEFSIYKRKKGDVVIAVTKGRILVSRKEESNAEPLQPVLSEPDEKLVQKTEMIAHNTTKPQYFSKKVLESGQEIIVDEKKMKYEVKTVDIQSVRTWQEGRLDFQDTPLLDVIKELNRYLENKIVLGDARLKDIRINVYFKIKNRKDFISTLKLVIPMTSYTNLNGQTVLTQRDT